MIAKNLTQTLSFSKKKNNLTKKFGFKKVDKYYRMALADLDTIKSNE